MTPGEKLDDFQVKRSRATEPLFYNAPAPPGRTPFQYQLAGVEYALARNAVLFGDEPGLGKSAETILLGNALGAKRTLVVCPASLRLNWEREIWQWSMIPNVTTYPVLKSADGVSDVASYVIISYNLLHNAAILDALLDLRWDHCILDEAHLIKDPRGNKRSTVITAPDLLPSVIGRWTLASGTILPNQPIECYNAVRLLNWDAIDRMSLDDFRQHYYEVGEGWVTVFDQAKGAWTRKYSTEVRNQPVNLDDLQFRLRKNVMVRRLKAQVLHELPPKQWHLFPMEITTEIRKALKHPGWRSVERMYELDPQHFNDDIAFDSDISTARRELGEAKAPGMCDYIEQLISEGVSKLVVSAWHLSVLHYMREQLKQHGLVYMDGSTSAGAKQRAVDQFQGSDKVRIILGQMLPLGEGWTLTAAQDAVLCEPYWVPGKNDQLFDRIHRIGQKANHVICHVPIVPGTIDEKVLSSAVKKDRHIHQALDAH